MLSREQIENIRSKVEEVSDSGNKKTSLWGMSYEQGILNAIDWILDDVEDGYEGEEIE